MEQFMQGRMVIRPCIFIIARRAVHLRSTWQSPWNKGLPRRKERSSQ